MKNFNTLHKTILLGIVTLSLIFSSSLSANYEEIKKLKRDGLNVLHEAHEKVLNYRKKIMSKLEDLGKKMKNEKEGEVDGKASGRKERLWAMKMKLKHMKEGVNGVLAKIYEQELNLGHNGKVAEDREAGEYVKEGRGRHIMREEIRDLEVR